MGDRASKIEDIAHTLEERGKKIDQLFPEGKERGMALSAAAAAAQAQRKALDTSGAGEKVGMGSALHDLIQKQLSDKDFTQETAKNTADANNKLDSLITAFNTRSIVAVAAP
jgi:cytochrome c556